VSGVTDGAAAFIQFSDDVFDATSATSSHNFEALGIPAFFNLDAKAILQVMQGVGSYLDVLSLKGLDNEPILLAAGTTIGDLITLAGVDGLPDLVGADALFREGFLDLIELPPHTASTLLTDIIGQPEDTETVAQVLGTSESAAPEFTITLRDGSDFDVNLDGIAFDPNSTTLGDIVNAIEAARDTAGFTDLTVHTNTDGSITLVDFSTPASDEDKLAVTPKQDGSGEDYAAAANLGLAGEGVERDLNGDDTLESVIDVAPNPGPRFVTLQEMNTQAAAGTNTSVTLVTYDPSTSIFTFTLDITKTFADASDTLALLDLGSLTDLVTISTVDLQNPTLTLHLPFELELTEQGFDTPLSASTSLSDLNLGSGVNFAEGADDLRVHLSDGTTFTVDLDPGLPATTLASLNGGTGVPTSGDAMADLSVTLNDGTTFDVDLDADLARPAPQPMRSSTAARSSRER
jgi:hypothetical protein